MAATEIFKRALSCPIVVIFGATGTGKSKLAIEIAKRFNGEIISADSMQVYTGLDIVTNKVTEVEQSGIPHHLMNFVNPSNGITVIDFRDRALKIIEELDARNKLPILVGGTMYYIESILFNVLTYYPDLENPSDNFTFGYDAGGGPREEEEAPCRGKKARFSEEEENASSEDLHKRLCQVDPEMGKVLHPSDRRKILRCLEMFRKSGEKMSVVLKKQKASPGADNYGGSIRFPRSVILWLKCDKDVLYERLERRVERMMDDGLVEELLNFHKAYNETRLEKNEAADYTRGIFQAIGFKEFHEYLILDEEIRKSKKGEELLKKSTEYLKIANKQYAKKQLRWIKHRFLRRGKGNVPLIYGLDATDASSWDEKVFAVAEDIVDCFLGERRPSLEPLAVADDTETDRNTIYKCEICNRYFQGGGQLEDHLKSRKHFNVIKALKKKSSGENECVPTEGAASNVSNNTNPEIESEGNV